MKLRSFITNSSPFGIRTLIKSCLRLSFTVLLLTAFSSILAAQKTAVLAPEKNQNSEKIVLQLTENLGAIDPDLAGNAFSSQSFENIFNLTTTEAKNLGRVIGCDFFILVKFETLRRTSFSKPLYFESYLTVYLISSRTGQLVFWTLKSYEADMKDKAEAQAFASLGRVEDEIKFNIKKTQESEMKEADLPDLEELPAENTPEAKNFKSPLPFRRYVPVYTRLANLYGITATVEATVALDENGRILRIEITRWAGYELDESVKETIKRMDWRPASRDGKNLPIRVLLRYNFKKIEKE